MLNDNDRFEVLMKNTKKPSSTQRELAAELGITLGKLNYCIKALKNKGLIKINNFKKKAPIKLTIYIFLHLRVYPYKMNKTN